MEAAQRGEQRRGQPAAVRPSAGMLHADLDAFYASVEQRDNPRLRGRPIIVGGGVVLTASYEARLCGVRTAMPGGEARRLCPEAIVVRPRMDAYTEASRAVFEIFHDTTPLVEGVSIDEAFLDVSGLRRIAGLPVEVAARLRTRVRDEVGLPITVGVARTKFLAKVASGVGKPDGLLVVEPGDEASFLHPLDVRALWGVGPVTAESLRAKGIHKVGDVAKLSEAALVSILGPASGRHIHALARLQDARPVVTGRRRSSIGSQRAMGRGPKTRAGLDEALLAIVVRVCERLRAGDRVARTVTLRLRDDAFCRHTRSRTLAQASDSTDLVLRTARQLLDDRWPYLRTHGCTLVGLTLGDLASADAVQLALSFDGHDRGALDRALDEVSVRFGARSVQRGSLVGRDLGLEMPMLPDPGAPAGPQR